MADMICAKKLYTEFVHLIGKLLNDGIFTTDFTSKYNMIEKFIIGKRIKGLYVFLYFYAQQSLESKYMDTN